MLFMCKVNSDSIPDRVFPPFQNKEFQEQNECFNKKQQHKERDF